MSETQNLVLSFLAYPGMVAVLDADDNLVGQLFASEDTKESLYKVYVAKRDGLLPLRDSGEVASIVEEVTAKTWEMAKARTARLIEVLCPDRLNEWKNGLNNETASLLGILLNDVYDASREVVGRHAPEITREMLMAAQEARLKQVALVKAGSLQDRVNELEEQLRDAKADLEQANRKGSMIGMPIPKA